MSRINERMFDGGLAESELEFALDDVGVPYERLGSDYYDNSLELYDVASDYELSTEARQIISDAGFSIVYVNHLDGSETHYSTRLGELDKPGWRKPAKAEGPR